MIWDPQIAIPKSMLTFRIAPQFQNRSKISELLQSFRISPQFQNMSDPYMPP